MDSNAPEGDPATAIETILVVEDQGMLRRLATRHLREAGYRVIEAASAEEAIDLAAAHAGVIELLLTDLVLPGAAGDALADRLVAVRPALQVIFMTGRPDAKTSLRAVAAGEAGFLGKPFGLRDLESAVRARLGPRGA